MHLEEVFANLQSKQQANEYTGHVADDAFLAWQRTSFRVLSLLRVYNEMFHDFLLHSNQPVKEHLL